jgi:hypothetical protein
MTFWRNRPEAIVVEESPSQNRVYVCSNDMMGRLSRYERDEKGRPRLTHVYQHPVMPCMFVGRAVELMRLSPADEWRVAVPEESPSPTAPNAAAARAA